MTFVNLSRYIIHQNKRGINKYEILTKAKLYCKKNNVDVDMNNIKSLSLLDTLFKDHNINNMTEQQRVISILRRL